MKKDINVTISGYICDEAFENYYRQLWSALREQYGDDILVELNKRYSEEMQGDCTENKSGWV
ncbi:hypothetical protein [uncultured Clostridium sp.]|uniref:hypothetical protein n=1 Tax=uncultured Clostridium sp. TaxID=59620 RepID=UPI0025F2E7D6|nr:hypothetical protein [uncultured Clostridium sp.]